MHFSNDDVFLTKVEKSHDPRMSEIMHIYRTSFPENERQSDETIVQRQQTNLNEIFVLENSIKEIYGIALLFPITRSDYILLDYLAIKESFKQFGFGSFLFQRIKDYVFQQNKKLIIEVEKPSGVQREEQEKRIKFYVKNGAKLLKDIDYYLPSINGQKNVEMNLMICQDLDDTSIEGALLIELITKIYNQVYQKDNNDELLISILNDIPKIVTFKI